MKFNKNVSSSRRKSRKAHFNASDAKRQAIMSSTLSKELKEQYHFKASPIEVDDEVLVITGGLKGKTAKVTKVDRSKYRVYLDISYREKRNGEVANYGVHSSNLQITKFALDKARSAKLEERKARALRREKSE